VTGAELLAIRRKLRLTQAQLAEQVGVAPNTIPRQERGEIGIGEPLARLLQILSTTDHTKRRRGR